MREWAIANERMDRALKTDIHSEIHDILKSKSNDGG